MKQKLYQSEFQGSKGPDDVITISAVLDNEVDPESDWTYSLDIKERRQYLTLQSGPQGVRYTIDQFIGALEDLKGQLSRDKVESSFQSMVEH